MVTPIFLGVGTRAARCHVPDQIFATVRDLRRGRARWADGTITNVDRSTTGKLRFGWSMTEIGPSRNNQVHTGPPDRFRRSYLREMEGRAQWRLSYLPNVGTCSMWRTSGKLGTSERELDLQYCIDLLCTSLLSQRGMTVRVPEFSFFRSEKKSDDF